MFPYKIVLLYSSNDTMRCGMLEKGHSLTSIRGSLSNRSQRNILVGFYASSDICVGHGRTFLYGRLLLTLPCMLEL
jgi:hypothetical protein